MQVLTWIPQNDILAHPNLRAFLSHVGINSMYEVRTLKRFQEYYKKKMSWLLIHSATSVFEVCKRDLASLVIVL